MIDVRGTLRNWRVARLSDHGTVVIRLTDDGPLGRAGDLRDSGEPPTAYDGIDYLTRAERGIVRAGLTPAGNLRGAVARAFAAWADADPTPRPSGRSEPTQAKENEMSKKSTTTRKPRTDESEPKSAIFQVARMRIRDEKGAERVIRRPIADVAGSEPNLRGKMAYGGTTHDVAQGKENPLVFVITSGGPFAAAEPKPAAKATNGNGGSKKAATRKAPAKKASKKKATRKPARKKAGTKPSAAPASPAPQAATA